MSTGSATAGSMKRHGSERTSGAEREAGHAVVIGASMAGLAAAAALAKQFDRVTIVERDRLPLNAASRKGVPQDRHLHLLLPAGAGALEELFPGVLGEMVASGAVGGDADRVRLSLNGYRLAPGRTGNTAVFASRPFVEAQVRRRVREHPAITIEDASAVDALVPSADKRRIIGLQISARDGRSDERVLSADLVVDCAGRGSRVPTWIQELGYEAPETDQLEVEVRYVTQNLALPSDALDGDHHVLIGPTPDGPRGGAMTRVGRGHWLVTLFAMGGEKVPREPAELRRFARQLPIRDIHDALRDGEAIGAPAEYRFPANVRRRYEALRTFPGGLLVAGDAVCSFNPIYGQGMSVAAIEAAILRRLLDSGSLPDARQWFDAIKPTIEAAWELATGADLAVNCIDGRRSLMTRAVNRYVRRFHAAAVADSTLTARFVRVAGLLDPPRALLHPAAVVRVMRGLFRGPGPRPRRTSSSHSGSPEQRRRP